MDSNFKPTSDTKKATPSHRGFAAMNAQKQREIASKGGRAAHQKGTAHEFSSQEASAAGRKGGLSVSQNRAHMSEIGRQGGRARSRAQAMPGAKQGSVGSTAECATQRGNDCAVDAKSMANMPAAQAGRVQGQSAECEQEKECSTDRNQH
jgi:general stress protein YciG